MGLNAPSETIAVIWKALNRPPTQMAHQPLTWSQLVEARWNFKLEIETVIERADRRLAYGPITPKALAEILELPWRYACSRPGSRFDDPIANKALRPTDVAAILILLERLGFIIDAEPLCALLRPALRASPHLSWQEVDVLFHDKSQHRTPPLTLSAREVTGWHGMNTTHLTTPLGYRVEYVEGDDGVPLWLTVSAPRYRKRAEPKKTKCAKCSMTYMKGLPSDDKQHREMHRLRMSALEPAPNRRFREARERDEFTASWVDYRSPKWKHELMYRRAFAFKRELAYDFSQWCLDPSNDPEPVGFLFADEDGRVVGAAAFRPQQGFARPWRLDWIWLAPGHRRQGYLDRHWERFRQRFGEFDIAPPVSGAMKAFLRKKGLDHLL
jgi:GNAT superfamily N-acetyltransferase